MTDECKAAQLELIKWLEDNHLLHCEYALDGVGLDGLTYKHSPNCRVCELKNRLKYEVLCQNTI